jgi:hypothetical protein
LPGRNSWPGWGRKRQGNRDRHRLLRSRSQSLACPNCGGDIRLIAFITQPGPIRKILTHLGEPLEPPPISPARGPPTDRGELVQAHHDREAVQVSPDELPVIDIHSL